MHMKATGLDASKLVLQIDETALAQDLSAVRTFIDKAKEMGCGMAINNFANRSVSAEQLAELPVDFIAVNDELGHACFFRSFDQAWLLIHSARSACSPHHLHSLVVAKTG